MFRDASDALDALRLGPHVVFTGAQPGASVLSCMLSSSNAVCILFHIVLSAMCILMMPCTFPPVFHRTSPGASSAGPVVMGFCSCCAAGGSDSSDDGSDGGNSGAGSPPPAPHSGPSDDSLARSLGARPQATHSQLARHWCRGMPAHRGSRATASACG